MTMQISAAVLRGVDDHSASNASSWPSRARVTSSSAWARRASATPTWRSCAAPSPCRCPWSWATRAPGSWSRWARPSASVAPGDHVVCSWNPACGLCFYCSRGQPLLCEVCGRAAGAGTLPGWPLAAAAMPTGPVRQFMFMGSHADHAVITEAAAVRVPRELPFGIGAAIGCGITTGLVPALRSPAGSDPGVGRGRRGLRHRGAVGGHRLTTGGRLHDRGHRSLARAARAGRPPGCGHRHRCRAATIRCPASRHSRPTAAPTTSSRPPGTPPPCARRSSWCDPEASSRCSGRSPSTTELPVPLQDVDGQQDHPPAGLR